MPDTIRVVFFLFLLAFVRMGQAQQSVASARLLPDGTQVTVEGVLMDGGDFAPNRFLQDSSAAIMLYLPSEEEESLLEANRGTLVRLTGIIDHYRGQVELSDVSSWQIIDSEVPLFEPLELELSEWTDAHSARYIELPAFQFSFPGLPLNQGTFEIERGGEEATLDYAGQAFITTDESAYSIRGFLQEDYSSYILRTSDTLYPSSQAFRTRPTIRHLDHRSVTIEWIGSAYMQDSVLLYTGDQTNLIQSMTDEDSVHQVTIDHLNPSTDYSLIIKSSVVPGREMIRFRTTDTYEDEIEFYFNYPVDTSIAGEWTPDGLTGLEAEQAVISRIEAAEDQIDFCMYNINRIEIVRALKRAHNRGVQVRYITDDETTNWALGQTSIPFPVVDGNVGDGLMHNKFIVIDPDRPEDAWIMTGAMNMTTGQIATDYNHLLFIREQSLALTYEQEFEEMWGGEGAQPVPSASRFGNDKTSNTPVYHSLFGENVELYFAPTDQVSDQISRLLAAGEHSIDFALLLLTQNELGNILVQSVEEGLEVRGIMENAFGPGSEFSFMKQNGVQVYEDIHSSAIFHHKYVLVDAQHPKPRLLTGSYNWSYSAEHMHDENTIIFHHPDIANVFLQDFEARFCEIVDCVTGVDISSEWNGSSLYPNPARMEVHLNLPGSLIDIPLIFSWFRSDGRLIRKTMRNSRTGILSFDVQNWAPGMYWLHISGADLNVALPLEIQAP